MSISEIKKAHFVGVGGIGMSALARIIQSRGASVSGSDLFDNENTRSLEKSGADIVIGEHLDKNLPKDADLIVYSSAVPETNAERQKAMTLSIPELDYHAALGELTENSSNIIIGGTHGKTTTTGLLGSILMNTDFDPTVIVGSNISVFEGNVRLGNPDHYVIEGDEFNRGILELNPNTVVLTNLEWDHPDIYETERDYISIFQDFVNKLPDDGMLVYNRDDHNITEHIMMPECHTASFSMLDPQAELFTQNIKQAHGRQIFRLIYRGNELKDFNLRIPGAYNVYNALAAALTAFEMGVDQDIIKDALSTFPGAERRFEVIGELKGAIVVSDYGHHPTELAAVVRAAKEFYEDKKIVVYFQPHQKARTRLLFNDFIKVLEDLPADKLYINEIYDVPGRGEEYDVSSKELVKKLNRESTYLPKLEEGFAEIAKELGSDDVLLVVGAGDIDATARNFLNS